MRRTGRRDATIDVPPPIAERRCPAENLAYALPARAPEMSPNYHQQPTIAPAATCEHEASAGFQPASNAWEHPRNA